MDRKLLWRLLTPAALIVAALVIHAATVTGPINARAAAQRADELADTYDHLTENLRTSAADTADAIRQHPDAPRWQAALERLHQKQGRKPP